MTATALEWVLRGLALLSFAAAVTIAMLDAKYAGGGTR